MTTLYGKTQSESDAEDASRCREIVSEVVRFGVSQRQILRLIDLLSLELEDRNLMLEISGITRRELGGLGEESVEQSGLIV